MEIIYIVSTNEKSATNEFKVGRHTGDLKQLYSRYTTYLVNPIIHYTKQVNVGTSPDIEKIIKKKIIP